jgi:hypothetical protein
MHYQRVRQHGTTELPPRPPRPTPEDRFWSKVEKTDTCWHWTAGCDARGYGQIGIGSSKVVYVHRFAYELLVGPIPDGHQVDHVCHNTVCVNPDHLRPATLKQNQENLKGARRNSKTGVRGVIPFRGRYRAEVRHKGKGIHVGVYDTLAEADAAVTAKRNELFTHNDLDRGESVA